MSSRLSFIVQLLLMNVVVALLIELVHASEIPVFERVWMSFRIGLLYLSIFTAGHMILVRLLLKTYPPTAIRQVQLRMLAHLALSVLLFLFTVELIRVLFDVNYLRSETAYFFIGLTVVMVPTILVFQGYVEEFFTRWKQSEQLADEAGLKALKAQIQPHFLFNSLNTIAGLISENPQKAEQMTVQVSSFLRRILQLSEQKTVPLSEELALANQYLDIQKERFQDQLHVTWQEKITSPSWQVPVLSIQPILENAFKYGMNRSADMLQLSVMVEASATHFKLEITDNGPGFGTREAAEILASGSGLRNIIQRFELHFPGQVTWQAKGNSFQLEVVLK